MTDLERDILNTKMDIHSLFASIRLCSDTTKELLLARYDTTGKRVRGNHQLCELFTWTPRQTSDRIVAALDELREIITGTAQRP